MCPFTLKFNYLSRRKKQNCDKLMHDTIDILCLSVMCESFVLITFVVNVLLRDLAA